MCSVVAKCELCGEIEVCYHHKGWDQQNWLVCMDCEHSDEFHDFVEGLSKCADCGDWFDPNSNHFYGCEAF